ncbi:GNAT family N-acetyltransferase [Pontibacter sp. E15-1]|uniref:GNAT family N-acetyltransferase n=1 Tax=Pontibacter sp. E15-1 TaxID=2919918 RepID=UPI001F4F7BCA|nr:GNAT family N-acetyltransferase [Pontibacter sp. E15-1]MCJ8164550.1 GNAT family N-acetyltransferase [Pontibacter sp. E15-1]
MAAAPLSYKRLTRQDAPELASLRKLYQEAFPLRERRTFGQVERLLEHPGMRCIAVMQGTLFAGFYISWRLGQFCFVEHFAIVSHLRGQGIGRQVVQRMLQDEALGVVLEVELPYSQASRRRILFYQSLGFSPIAGLTYHQPPYRSGEAPLPLCLMSSFPLTDPAEQDRAVRAIHEQVYARFMV